MFKKLICIILTVVLCLPLIGCEKEPTKTYHETLLEKIETEAVSLIDWMKLEAGLKKSDDLSKLSIVENDYSGKNALSVANIKLIRFAKYFSYNIDYNNLIGKIEKSLLELYSQIDDINSAPVASINNLSLLIDDTGLNSQDFCGYNLVSVGAYNNIGLGFFADIYSLPSMLDVLYGKTIFNNAKYQANDIIELVLSKQTPDSGFNWDGTGTDIDTTAMVLSSLALYQNDDNLPQNFVSVIDQAVAAMLEYKNNDGTYFNMYSPSSSSSTAVALSALSLLGKDIFTSDFFEKEFDPCSILYNFKNEDGGYRSVTDDAPSDMYSGIDILNAYYNIHKFIKKEVYKQNENFEASIFINCIEAVKNKDKLNSATVLLLPTNGLIVEKTTVTIKAKQTVFTVLTDLLKSRKIHFETATGGYVRAINNLYELDCGTESGWLLIVNGNLLPSGAKSYYVKEGDNIMWLYSVVKGDVI